MFRNGVKNIDPMDHAPRKTCRVKGKKEKGLGGRSKTVFHRMVKLTLTLRSVVQKRDGETDKSNAKREKNRKRKADKLGFPDLSKVDQQILNFLKTTSDEVAITPGVRKNGRRPIMRLAAIYNLKVSRIGQSCFVLNKTGKETLPNEDGIARKEAMLESCSRNREDIIAGKLQNNDV